MLEWQDVIPYVASKLGQDAQHIPAILKFLHVLPEEVTEGRKINLSVCSTDTSHPGSSLARSLPSKSKSNVIWGGVGRGVEPKNCGIATG